jgi:subtilisin family serine protease
VLRHSRYGRAERRCRQALERLRALKRGRPLLTGSLAVTVIAVCTPFASAATPNDPSFPLQWGSSNTGQLIPTQESEEELGPAAKGTPGADDRALEGWGVTTGSRSIVIGVVDTGVDYNDSDLAANIWSNPGGIGGCPSGSHGFNLLEPLRKCTPLDEEPGGASGYGGHGTHVAGIIGAVGDNGAGVTGINWQASILPVKWLSSASTNTNSTEVLIKALEAVVAAKQAGVNVRVVNDSATFLGTPYSQALANEIDTLGANNILFVTAAGNTGDNNDVEKVRRYPCGYDRPTEICVTATDNNDKLPNWANYGPNTVDLAAPGVSIYSTLRNGAYGYLSGGSMAAAQVSGAAALILSAQPSLSVTQLKDRILDDVQTLPALAGKVRTGGRLDVARALPGAVAQVTPNSGPSSGGTSVSITGANLSRATAVEFGASSASSFTIHSPISITATSPPGSGTVDVTVTTPSGTSAPMIGDRFTYEAPSPVPVSPGSVGQPTVGQGAVLGATSVVSKIVLVTTALGVRNGRVAVKLRCIGSRACTGRLRIAVKQVLAHGTGKPVTTRLRTIGHAAFSLRAGQSKSVAVALDEAGRARLRGAHGRLNALLSFPSSAPGATRTVNKSVRLRSAY